MCKKRGEEVRRCMIPVCGKFYHGECITSYAPTAPVNRGFRCSIHVCLTCFIANPSSPSICKGKRTHRYLTFCLLFTFVSLRAHVFVCRSSGALRALPRSLPCYRCVHGSRQRCPLQQQHHLSQPLHPQTRRQEPRTRQCQLVLRLHRRYGSGNMWSTLLYFMLKSR